MPLSCGVPFGGSKRSFCAYSSAIFDAGLGSGFDLCFFISDLHLVPVDSVLEQGLHAKVPGGLSKEGK
jgi:hypothetical protein